MSRSRKPASERPESLTERIYARVKQDIFEYRLLPGDHFTETEIAERTDASRTPVREALARLQRDGFVQVHFRNGWQVKPLDFDLIDQLYDIRTILEMAAVEKLCSMEKPPNLADLKKVWLVSPEERLSDGPTVCALDERFHEQIVEAAGNAEMARMHHEITERIRVVRHLDFIKPDRVDATYQEHGQILWNLIRRNLPRTRLLLTSHIDGSKSSVQKITLHMLHRAKADQ